ncbi:hypothetical protein QYM36_017674 [Artemia franciscana]|uniref:RRM domain-containing protein n=1 Tax=Artemia franciscana TaxID=6661 RepID=A0AA88H614_ARTSF|nr:hypothetical protein QYM36_017674 [Artemia franciscana]
MPSIMVSVEYLSCNLITMKKYDRRKSDTNEGVSNVLSIKFTKNDEECPPLTVHSIYEQFSEFGEVVQIVIETTDPSNVTVFVEYENDYDTANRAKKRITDRGYDIHFSYCPLVVEELSVFSAWDFKKNPNLPPFAIAIENLERRVTCKDLYSLISPYGFVKMIKFLDDDIAVVQMEYENEVCSILKYLDGEPLFGKKVEISVLEGVFLHENDTPFILENGSPSFMSVFNTSIARPYCLLSMVDSTETAIGEMATGRKEFYGLSDSQLLCAHFFMHK